MNSVSIYVTQDANGNINKAALTNKNSLLGGIKVINTCVNDYITISPGGAVDVNTFFKNLQYFTIVNGVLFYKDGYNSTNLDDSVIELDNSLPQAFTRANTVVNFGRL